jgi:hypothetical protein
MTDRSEGFTAPTLVVGREPAVQTCFYNVDYRVPTP